VFFDAPSQIISDADIKELRAKREVEKLRAEDSEVERRMFCPLCKAEYRQGFSTCSDCRIPLVGTEDEACHTDIDRLWKGEKRSEFDRVIAALTDAGIPFQPKEKLRPRVKLKLSSIPLSLRSSFYYEIWVLRGDLERANKSMEGLFDDVDLDSEE